MWMIKNAQDHGLNFDNKLVAQYAVEAAERMDNVNESWKKEWGPPIPRDVPPGSQLNPQVSLRAAFNEGHLPRNIGKGSRVALDGTDPGKKTRRPGDWAPYREAKRAPL
jgi:hypothetical protein